MLTTWLVDLAVGERGHARRPRGAGSTEPWADERRLRRRRSCVVSPSMPLCGFWWYALVAPRRCSRWRQWVLSSLLRPMGGWGDIEIPVTRVESAPTPCWPGPSRAWPNHNQRAPCKQQMLDHREVSEMLAPVVRSPCLPCPARWMRRDRFNRKGRGQLCRAVVRRLPVPIEPCHVPQPIGVLVLEQLLHERIHLDTRVPQS